MITVILESGEKILCDKLIGVAFKGEGGQVAHIVDGPCDIIDAHYVKKIMEQQVDAIINTELQKRVNEDSKKPKIHVPKAHPQAKN